MDTVKVDLQKLQILNDRIAQTIEALNQVRLTVHGLSHTNPYGQAYGQPYGQPYGQAYGQGYPSSPFAQPLGGLPPQVGAPGLTHTSPSPWGGPQQFGYPGLTPQFAPQMPYGAQPFGPFGQGISHTSPWLPQQAIGVPSPWLGANIQPQVFGPPVVGQPMGMLPFGGIGIQHSSSAFDPLQAMRFAQAFPYALYNVPPVTIY